MTFFFCSSCLSEGEQAAKLLKITWMIFPFGVIAAIPACLVIFCFQAISYSDPRGKAILIYGNLFSSSNFSHAFFKLHAFSVIKCCLVIIVLLLPSGCNLSIVYLKTQKEGGDMFDNFCSLKKKKKEKQKRHLTMRKIGSVCLQFLKTVFCSKNKENMENIENTFGSSFFFFGCEK